MELKDPKLNRIQVAYLIQVLEDTQEALDSRDPDEHAIIQLMIDKLNASRNK